MQFNKETPIYIQIKDVVYNAILSGEYCGGERIPSIRDMAVSLEVNPNTVTRTYSILQEEGVIENQRGLGYFAVENAKDVVLNQMKDEFLTVEVPLFFSKMERLGIPMEKITTLYSEPKKWRKT
ncbi:MAG: GntR family transcriptional regulator [Sphaerochaetaceae bacterium]